jgi:hypothetical protein
VATGVFTAFGLYGYFSGRFIFIAVALVAGLAIALRQAPWRRTLLGLGVAAAVSAILFAPMAVKIARHWDFFNNRTQAVSIFTEIPDAANATTEEGRLQGWPLAWYNAKRNFRGLVLLDSGVVDSGIWIRYTPSERPPLDRIAGALFWAGLVIAATVRRRDAYAWWPFFVPLVIVEVFSRGTPDLARGIIFAPFYFLFIGLTFDEGFRRLRGWPLKAAGVGVAVAMVTWVSTAEVREYFDWQSRNFTQGGRLPGIDICEFHAWSVLARDAAEHGTLVKTEDVLAIRRLNRCSGVIFGPRYQGAP